MAAPIILADNRFLDSVPTASGVTDGSAICVRDCRTYTILQFPNAGTNYLTVNCGAARAANCLGVIGHNLNTAASLVSVEYSQDGANWSPVMAPFAPVSDKAFLRTFVQLPASWWRLKIVTASVAPRLAVVMLGSRMDFQYPPDPGTPLTVSVVEESKDSVTGNPLGSVVHYSPIDVKPQFSNVDRSWVETVYRPFWMNYARLRKWFFWAWDIDAYSEDVLFVRDQGTYDPSVSVLSYYDALKLTLKGVLEP
jgi:hypothetical protein